ncbi:hypothetical protein IG631_22602 [Alternaria alternata]|jgi:hypothetical protein|nr:hypothetical protein IG631_22602 [Alternaria alternata]
MRPTLVLCPLLTALSNAQLDPRADNTRKELEMPPEFKSLLESVELQASSVVNDLHSAYSHIATAVPTDPLTDIGRLLPTQTPDANATANDAISSNMFHSVLVLGLVVVAVTCCALG